MLSTFLGRFPCLIMGVRQCKRQRAQVLPAQQGLRVWVCPVPKSPSAMGTTTRKQSYSAGVRALRLAILFSTPARSRRSSFFHFLFARLPVSAPRFFNFFLVQSAALYDGARRFGSAEKARPFHNAFLVSRFGVGDNGENFSGCVSFSFFCARSILRLGFSSLAVSPCSPVPLVRVVGLRVF